LAEQILLEQMASEVAKDSPDEEAKALRQVVARKKSNLAVPSQKVKSSRGRGVLVQILIVLLSLLAAGLIAYLTGVLTF
jgi:hypothetical protein